MHNDKTAPLSPDNIADAKLETPVAEDKTSTSDKAEKAESAAKKPRRKLGSAGGAAG